MQNMKIFYVMRSHYFIAIIKVKIYIFHFDEAVVTTITQKTNKMLDSKNEFLNIVSNTWYAL